MGWSNYESGWIHITGIPSIRIRSPQVDEAAVIVFVEDENFLSDGMLNAAFSTTLMPILAERLKPWVAVVIPVYFLIALCACKELYA
jgi:hypothetical protein